MGVQYMKTFFTDIAFIRCAARLCGFHLYDNYAYHGMLARNRCLSDFSAAPVPDIDDVPEKAASFQFGIRCARALYSLTDDLDADIALARDAMIARAFFLDLDSDEAKKILASHSVCQLAEELSVILRAYIKRAQIQTHTAKPGYEDVEAWILRYHKLLEDYENVLPQLTILMLSPGAAAADFTSFFDCTDPIISLAMSSGIDVTPELVQDNLTGNTSVFGRALALVCSQNLR